MYNIGDGGGRGERGPFAVYTLHHDQTPSSEFLCLGGES